MARLDISQLDPRLVSVDQAGSVNLSGSLNVQGQSTFTQIDPNEPAVVISGALEVVQAQIDQAVQLATIRIENLGAISDPGEETTIDLGGFF